MPIPGVPGGLLRQVRDAFVAALKNDVKLANNRVIKTWIAWDGKGPIAEPTVAQLPAIQIRLLSGPVSRIAIARAPGQPMRNINESTLSVIIDLWTAGTDQCDLADLADLIRIALNPQDSSVRTNLQAKFREAGIKDWQLTREILPMSAESFTLEGIAGQGAYSLTVQSYA